MAQPPSLKTDPLFPREARARRESGRGARFIELARSFAIPRNVKVGRVSPSAQRMCSRRRNGALGGARLTSDGKGSRPVGTGQRRGGVVRQTTPRAAAGLRPILDAGRLDRSAACIRAGQKQRRLPAVELKTSNNSGTYRARTLGTARNGSE